MASRLICIGDIHGNLTELESLWNALRARLGCELDTATVVFLGDYCDRGPNTRGCLDFMIHLKHTREAQPESGGTFFIAGNHDFAFAAYLGCLPNSGPLAIDLDKTTPIGYCSGFWPYSAEGGMHYQGRRWGGSSTYDAASTFLSYGVRLTYAESDRQQLCDAVPESHKHFLRGLAWIHEQPLSFAPGSAVCVHAGLNPDGPLAPQMASLRARDLGACELHERTKDRIAALVGRRNVLPMHPELEGRALLISGHHGVHFISGDRIVLDESGGTPSGPPRARALQAIILPERSVVPHYELRAMPE